MSATTLALGILAIGAVVFFVGVDSTRMAAAKTGKTIKSNANRSVALGAGGAIAGLQFGDALVNAILANTGFSLAAVAGVMGALGIEGFLGDITGFQFLLIGFVAFATIFAVFGGGDD